MISISAEHMYGIHTNVLSFAKWNSSEVLLICVNFNAAAIDMHFNLTNLKYVFSNAFKSTLVVHITDLLHENGINQMYTVKELMSEKIEAHIDKYQSLVWKISVCGNENEHLERAYEQSIKRVVERLSRQPPRWIYSSVLTN